MAMFGWVSSNFKDTSKQAVTVTQNAEATADYSDTWCGSWDTKLEALKSLFNWYKKKSMKTIRWYVDTNGQFRWFEVGERTSQEIIFEDDERVESFEVDEDAYNIVNDMTGTYGSGDETGQIHLTNPESIEIHGKCVDDKIQEASFDAVKMTQYLQWQLDQKSVPVYTAVLVLKGLYEVEPGRQMMFPNSPNYGSILFTVVDITMAGTAEGGNNTTLNLSSIDTSLPNEFEVMQSIAESESDKVRSKVGTVVGASGDRVVVELEGNRGTINARYVSKL